MEKSEYSFGAYRYFIVPNDQISLFDAIEEKRKKAVQNFFSALVEEKKRSWEIKGRKHLLVFNRQVSSSVFICKFSMETKKTIFIESESDIENIDEIDYPFIYVIIVTSHQIVLFELKPSVFSSLNVSKDKLKICFEKIFSLYGFEVLFEEITDSNTFWTFVNDSRGIFEISMTLNSPNLFGGFNNTNEMLKEVQETYNNSQTTIKLTSKKPILHNIKPDNKPLSDAVEYVSGGGGEWILTVASKSGERKKYKSKHNIRKVSIRHINSKSHQNGAKTDILHALDSLETILKKEHTDEETD